MSYEWRHFFNVYVPACDLEKISFVTTVKTVGLIMHV